MRGGRNKFGPLYRRDRQMKQQKGFHQTNTAPYRIKTETTQIHRPTAPNDHHLMSSHTSAPLPSDTFHQSHMYPSGIGQSGAPTPLDCTMNADMVLTPPSLPYHGLYHRTSFPGYLQEKGEMPFSYSTAPANYPVHPTPNNSFTLRSTPASSPSSTANSATLLSQPPAQNPAAPSSATLTCNFLSQLLEGEQDESQLCAKVVASLQREQANRGKHDRLNTFSIMCKMADQTLFGLVEWARNSALFKELKVINDELINLIKPSINTLEINSVSSPMALTFCRVGCLLKFKGHSLNLQLHQIHFFFHIPSGRGPDGAAAELLE